jgi:hypothetical protein
MSEFLSGEDIRDAVSLERSNICWSEWPGPQAIADAVREWGIAVFPGFLSGETLDVLNSEFDQIIDLHRDGNGPFSSDNYDNIVNVRLQRESIPQGAIPVTAALFAHADLKAVSDAYFHGEPYTLNREIFVSNLEETRTEQTKPPFADHFDKLNLFKFFSICRIRTRPTARCAQLPDQTKSFALTGSRQSKRLGLSPSIISCTEMFRRCRLPGLPELCLFSTPMSATVPVKCRPENPGGPCVGIAPVLKRSRIIWLHK